MPTSDQQKQTLSFFDANAKDWQDKAQGRKLKVNVISQRNRCALAYAEEISPPGSLLDVGCVTGELVLEAAALGHQSIGIDYAPEMISHCEESKQAADQPLANFHTVSVFDHDGEGAPYDVIAAMGLIEYISPVELDAFLEKAVAWLKPGGVAVIGSRNRLFNLFSMNAFTEQERELGAFEDLVSETMAFTSGETQADAVAKAEGVARDYPHPDRHPDTGIGVQQRLQYTPGRLAQILRAKGLVAERATGVHFHAMPLACAKDWKDAHIAISEGVYDRSRNDPRLLPQCSSFVIATRKQS